MSSSRRNWIVSLATIGVIILSACSPRTNQDTPNDNSVSDSNELDATQEPAKAGSIDLPVDNFPRTPDPITVQVTLDTANAAKASSFDFPFYVKGKSADETPFEIYLDNKLYSKDADGNLNGAFGTEVTLTPVSAIEGLPFSEGFLTAIQIGPEGLLMAEPGMLQLNVKGNVIDQDLIGFAADGSGGDFHLFPVNGYYSDYSDTTQFNFSVMHFSLYGVAKVVAGEIEAQQAHPPASPAAQDEDELAPLLPIKSDDLTPLMNKLQLQLAKSHSRLVKPELDKLAATKCEQVTASAYRFNEWRSKVDKAFQNDYFQQQIDSDGNALHERFIECAKELCPTCINNQSSEKPNAAKINSVITLATFAEDLSFYLGYDDFAWWRQLSRECALRGGLRSPAGSTGGDTSGEGPVATPVPFACPL